MLGGVEVGVLVGDWAKLRTIADGGSRVLVDESAQVVVYFLH